MLREFKINCLSTNGNGEILDAQSFIPDFSDTMTIKVYDDTPECNIELAKIEESQRRERNQKEKIRRLNNPSRAMKKRELEQMIQIYEECERSDNSR